MRTSVNGCTLNRDESHGETVVLEERNGRLLIVKHGFWIV